MRVHIGSVDCASNFIQPRLIGKCALTGIPVYAAVAAMGQQSRIKDQEVNKRMTRLLGLLIILMLWTKETAGQSDTRSQTADSTVTERLYVVDRPAEFPGGMVKFYEKYISRNIKYPKDAKKLGIEGKVYVEFVVESTGEIRQESVRVIKGIYSSCDNEAVRLIKKSPRWTPGFSSELNKNAAQRFAIPIIFKLRR